MQFSIDDDSTLANSIWLNNLKKKRLTIVTEELRSMPENIVYQYEKLYMETSASGKH